VRYAAVYSFFLEGLPAASSRLKAFVEKAALASLHGDVFDDAATGQGLLNFFLRGIACGAITEDEALATGLTLDEIRSRSFLKILLGRRKSLSTTAVQASSFSFTLNGEHVEVRDVPPDTTLLDWLRSNQRVGTKCGCNEGDCGACTVALLDTDARGRPAWRAINSCIALLPMFAGRELVTVEGLARGDALHPVQACMVKHYGSQCGYCTPGFVMSLFEGFYRDDLRERWQIGDQLCGNLCRCTGYRPIPRCGAGGFAQRTKTDAFGARLGDEAAPLRALRYETKAEHFFRPTSLAELFALLRQHPEAKLVAGATEIGVLIKQALHPASRN